MQIRVANVDVDVDVDVDVVGERGSQNGGSVAVHCLAGIHRAACIVACHFLFRS